MFKKIMNIMFVALITAAPILSIANTNAGVEIKTASLEVGSTVFKGESKIQLAKVEQVVGSVSYKKIDQAYLQLRVNKSVQLPSPLGLGCASDFERCQRDIR